MPFANRVGIVLSGTAPSLTLMSGAMLAFAEQNVEFEVISATGVGALIGLTYLAPQGGDRKKALHELKNLFVSDWLHKLFPVNFKVFHKYSPFAPAFYAFRKTLPKFQVEPDDPAEIKRLLNDWLQLWATAITPRSLETRHNGLLSHIPLIQDLVDFEKLKTTEFATRFYMNAFSLRSLKMRYFVNKTQPAGNNTITPEAYNGAQAMFVLFPPVYTADDILTTGATRDPTGLQAIWSFERRNLDRVIALDPLTKSFWRMPANAYDAFQLMIMNPIAALQQLMFRLYLDAKAAGADLPRLQILQAAIDPSYYPKMLEWTHANALALHKIGYDAAVRYAEALATNHPNLSILDERRYDFAAYLEAQPRAEQFRTMFKDLFETTNFQRAVDYLRTERYGLPPLRGRQEAT